MNTQSTTRTYWALYYPTRDWWYAKQAKEGWFPAVDPILRHRFWCIEDAQDILKDLHNSVSKE